MLQTLDARTGDDGVGRVIDGNRVRVRARALSGCRVELLLARWSRRGRGRIEQGVQLLVTGLEKVQASTGVPEWPGPRVRMRGVRVERAQGRVGRGMGVGHVTELL